MLRSHTTAAAGSHQHTDSDSLLPHTYNKTDKPHNRGLTSPPILFTIGCIIFFFLLTFIYFHTLSSTTTPLISHDGPAWLYSKANSVIPTTVHTVIPAHITSVSIPSPANSDSPTVIEPIDPLEDVSTIRAHWFQEWSSTREILELLDQDLSEFFPSSSSSASFTELIAQRAVAQRPQPTLPTPFTKHKYLMQPPELPPSHLEAPPPSAVDSVGTPLISSGHRGFRRSSSESMWFETRGMLQGFFLQFPLPRTKVMWDLSRLVDTTAGTTPKPFPFPKWLTIHPSVSNSALEDLHRFRLMLILAAKNQGTKVDPKTGEEPGKILSDSSDFTSSTTRWKSTETTALWMIGMIHYFHLTNDLAFLQSHLPHLLAAYQYILTHIDFKSGLVLENPHKYVGELSRGLSDSPKPDRSRGPVHMWKNLFAFHRSEGKTSFKYPTSFILVQAQTLAAVRALSSLNQLLQQFHQTAPSSETSIMSEMATVLQDGLEKTQHHDLAEVTQTILKGLRTYYFGRPRSEEDEKEVPRDQLAIPLPLIHRIESDSSESDSTPTTPHLKCPYWGFDSGGSLSLPVDGLKDGDQELQTSEALHALFYLNVNDLTEEELKRWFGGNGEDPSAATSTDPDSPTPWQVGCFQALESSIGGYVSSNLEREPIHPTGSILTLRRKTPGHSIHPYALFTHEQGFIHAAARRFNLGHVEKQTRHFFRALDRTRKQLIEEGDLSDKLKIFPEYFLPNGIVDRPEVTQLILRPISATHTQVHDARQNVRVRENRWLGETSVHLDSLTAWNYWIQYSYGVVERRLRASGQVRALGASSALMTAIFTQSPCLRDEEHVERGVATQERFRFCPSATTTVTTTPHAVSSTPRPVYPALIFTCLDSSALIWLTQVNDDYCDCLDGSDELGTAACSGHYGSSELDRPDLQAARFPCSAESKLIHRTFVDDGICDCCDGSDERDSGVHCQNRCK